MTNLTQARIDLAAARQRHAEASAAHAQAASAETSDLLRAAIAHCQIAIEALRRTLEHPAELLHTRELPPDLEGALRGLLRWATGGDRTGNPYCVPEVKAGLQALATIDGHNDPLGVDLKKEIR